MFDDEDETCVTRELKREAIALRESSSRPLMQIATELRISPSMLRDWQAVMNGGPPRSRTGSRTLLPSASSMVSPANQAVEIARLRRLICR